jgi:hypothetical protein
MNDGGQAFPRPASEFTKNGTLPDGNSAEEAQAGMSLRDYFAAKAMQVIGLNNSGDSISTKAVLLAKNAYIVADAMIAAKKA